MMKPLVDTKVLNPAQMAVALGLITEMDFLRLKAIARLHARGLPPDVDWDDLLQEAMTRAIVGARQAPHGVTMVAFLAGVMRSLRSEHWRRARREWGVARRCSSTTRVITRATSISAMPHRTLSVC